MRLHGYDAGLHVTGIGLGSLTERSIGKFAVRVMDGRKVLGGVALIAG